MRHMIARRHPRSRTVANGISGLLVAAVCLLAVLTILVPLAMGATPYTVLTGSMRPTLEPGSLVGVRPIDIADVRPGDIVTFQLRSGEPEVATHRVIGVTEDGHGRRELTTRGDANNVADAAPVRAEQLRGVVVYAVPWLGYVNAWADPVVKSALVTVLGVVAVAYGVALLIADGVRRRRRGRRAAAAVLALAMAAAGAVCMPAPASAVPVPGSISAGTGNSSAPASSAPASSATGVGELQISVDGTTWTVGGGVSLFSGEDLVPGDEVTRPVWVRNRSDDPAVPSLQLAWEPADPSVAADVALARALGAEVEGVQVQGGAWSGTALPPGATRAIRVAAVVPWDTGSAARNGRAELTIVVRLTEAAIRTEPPAGPAGSLPVTGGGLWPLAGPIALLGIATGVALKVWGRRRRPRITAR